MRNIIVYLWKKIDEMAFLHDNYSLRDLNSFGIEAKAKYFFEFETIEEIQELLKTNNISDSQFLILGGGSNLLFTEDYDGLVIKPNIKGIEIHEENETEAIVKAGACVDWDEFVAWCVENDLSGVENLSLIPGVVGATPIQNIGAYGVEAQEVIEKVEAVSIETAARGFFSNKDCQFAYRDSIFKNEYKDLFIITNVFFKLKKKHEFKTHYGAIASELEKYNEINLKNIREVIIKIREAKLPDPKEIGNAGSFFKNPVIESSKAQELKELYPEMPVYPLENGETKIAAGWLIEQCGWKGKSKGNAGVHKDQALVLVNNGGATGNEILILANEIRKSVIFKFGVKLDLEVITI